MSKKHLLIDKVNKGCYNYMIAKKQGGISMNEKKNLDDFWNIDDIVPKKRIHTKGSVPEVAEINVAQNSAPASVPLTSSAHEKALHRATELLLEYSPKNPLIENVKLFAWPSSYNYYEKFKADARYFFSRTGEECEYTPFFSYIPQYYQLTKSQLAFYLWFRENARKGEYIFCDFSYIMLYIYELINIPEMLPSEETLSRLCGLWKAYRDRFPRLDKYLVEWICDFCLINRIAPDMNELSPIYKDIIDSASFKEFYTPAAKDKTKAYALLAIGALSTYDFKKSKYAKEDAAALFEDKIVGAIAFALEENRLFDTSTMRTVTTRRDSFGGALCASNIKRVIEITHMSLSQSYELRSVITNAVKYAENCVRASLGIKSRLGNLTLPPNIRESIDAYMAENLTSRRAKKVEVPEYERRYELPSKPISAEHAKDIELASWQTTQMLVDAFEEEKEVTEIPKIQEITAPEAGEDVFADLISILGEDEIEFIRLALREDTAAQNELCRKLGKLPDVAVEMINSSAADICGDIILEEKDGGFVLIEDYKEDIAKWIK